MCLQLPDGTDDQWLELLKPYQKNSLAVLLEKHSYEETASIWLSSNGPEGIARFGGDGDAKPFWDRFKTEFRKFICGDDSYEDDRKSLTDQGPITRELLVATVSSALGAQIGYPATFLAPATTLLLISVGKMGVNAYCNGGEPSRAPENGS